MPAAVAVPLITGAITAGSTLTAAKMGANTARKASAIQSQYADRALNDEMQQRSRAQSEYDAWMSGPEMQALGAFVRQSTGGASSPGTGGAQPPVSRAMAPTMSLAQMRSAGTGQTSAAAANTGMVTLKAPTGEMRQFAPNDPALARHLARGARRIG